MSSDYEVFVDSVPVGSYDTLKAALAAMREVVPTVRQRSAIIQVVDPLNDIVAEIKVVFVPKLAPTSRPCAALCASVSTLSTFALGVAS